MRAGNWAGLGVLFLLGSCVFPPFALGALICFIGMVIAMQVKTPTMAGVQTAQGIVQATTNAHWSMFERPVGEFAGVYRIPLATMSDGERAKLSGNMRIGEPLTVTHRRGKDDRGVIRDALVVFNASGTMLGTIPPQLEGEYMDAFRNERASFSGEVHHISTDSGEPVVLAKFERSDAPYLSRVRRRNLFNKFAPYIVTLLALVFLIRLFVWAMGQIA